MAEERGRQDIVALLEARGATPVSAGTKASIPDLVMSRSTAAIRALLAAGKPVDERGDMGATALHWACWKGYADLAKLLIDRGAPLTVLDTEFHATPAGWFHHGASNSPDGGAHAEVARLLIAANAPMEGCNTPTGNTEVDAILREHKLIE
jgi:ankyrin repeat protein